MEAGSFDPHWGMAIAGTARVRSEPRWTLSRSGLLVLHEILTTIYIHTHCLQRRLLPQDLKIKPAQDIEFYHSAPISPFNHKSNRSQFQLLIR